MAKLTFDTEKCKGCELCVYACPKKLLSLDKEKINSKGYNAAKIVNQEECTACAACARMCPDCIITVEK